MPRLDTHGRSASTPKRSIACRGVANVPRDGADCKDALSAVDGDSPPLAEFSTDAAASVRTPKCAGFSLLETDLGSHGLWKVRDLLAAQDRVNESIEGLGRRLQAGLAEYEDQLRLLEPVPGIDRGSACAIVVELGPDLSAFPSPRHVAVWLAWHRATIRVRASGARAGSAAATRRSGRPWPSVRTVRCNATEHNSGCVRKSPQGSLGLQAQHSGRGAQDAANDSGEVRGQPTVHGSRHWLSGTRRAGQRLSLAHDPEATRLLGYRAGSEYRERLDISAEPPSKSGAVTAIERGYSDGLQNPRDISVTDRSLRNAWASGFRDRCIQIPARFTAEDEGRG